MAKRKWRMRGEEDKIVDIEDRREKGGEKKSIRVKHRAGRVFDRKGLIMKICRRNTVQEGQRVRILEERGGNK